MSHSALLVNTHEDGVLQAQDELGVHHLHGCLLAVKVHTHEGGELQAQHEAVVHHLGCYQHSDFL